MKNAKRLMPVATICLGLWAAQAGAQTWSLTSCPNKNFPNIDKNQGKFPPGSCPPPADIKITCPGDTKIKIDTAKVYASTWETGYWHPPKYAVDQYMSTRWSSFGSDKNVTWTADFGEEKAFNRVIITWEVAHGKGYDILTTNDTAGAWTTVKEYRNGNGFIDTVDAPGKGRYIRMHGIDKGADQSWGFSMFDFTVCADPSAASARRAEGASPKSRSRWRVVMGPGFQPVGVVPAFDVNGRALAP